jgi:hypothetical protein
MKAILATFAADIKQAGVREDKKLDTLIANVDTNEESFVGFAEF